MEGGSEVKKEQSFISFNLFFFNGIHLRLVKLLCQEDRVIKNALHTNNTVMF